MPILIKPPGPLHAAGIGHVGVVIAHAQGNRGIGVVLQGKIIAAGQAPQREGVAADRLIERHLTGYQRAVLQRQLICQRNRSARRAADPRVGRKVLALVGNSGTAGVTRFVESTRAAEDAAKRHRAVRG